MTGLVTADFGSFGRAAAQGATATPGATGTGLAADNSTLFVQTASGGTMTPNAPPVPGATSIPDQHGAYLLTLQAHSGETVAFRPARLRRGHDGQFFTALGFLPTNPPNALPVVDTPEQQGAVVLVELLAPNYASATHALTYEPNLLHQYPNPKSDGLAALAAKGEATPPAAFTNAALFIDDCPGIQLECYNVNDPNTIVGTTMAGTCYQWWPPGCVLCQNTCPTCNANVPACGGQCRGECPGGCPTG